VVGQRAITLREQIAIRDGVLQIRQGEGLTLQTIAQDPACDIKSLRIYSATNYTGNTICIKGSGDGALNDFFQYSGGPSWAGAIRSWKGGIRTGYWTASGTQCGLTIDQFVNVSSGDSCTNAATHIHQN
jgi:hypothetical protein